VDNALHMRKSILCTLQDKMGMAQNRMKQQLDQHRFKHAFVEGDEVFLCLQLYTRHHSKTKHPIN
jgi:hypothetical protein